MYGRNGIFCAGLAVFGFVSLVWLSGLLAQPGSHHHGRGHGSFPDSLNTIQVSGTVIVDSSSVHPLYYLDEDGDTRPDFVLMLGPWWYRPESGAEWPQHGEQVTVTGSIVPHQSTGLSGIIVFTINGQTWRPAVAVGSHGWHEGRFWENQGDTLTVSGVVLVDTTHYYPMYFLDVDGDSLPEYKLSLGPFWYRPDNGLEPPAHGQQVTIWGRLHESMMGINVLTVYTINGRVWRPANGPAPWAGQWIRRDHADSVWVYCVNDSANWIEFAPGHMGHGGMGMGGMRWPDSVFVQFWEIYPDSLPGTHEPGFFRGFYIDMNDPGGGSMMGMGNWGGHHGRMVFEKDHRLVLHYDDDELGRLGLKESTLSLRAWDPGGGQWRQVTNAVVDPAANTVTYTGKELNTYYALSAEPIATTVDEAVLQPPARFELLGNYPNPFNPETAITFRLYTDGRIRMEIYNLLGQKVLTLIDDTFPAGLHRVKWDGRDYAGRSLPAGIYLLRVQAGQTAALHRMTLLK